MNASMILWAEIEILAADRQIEVRKNTKLTPSQRYTAWVNGTKVFNGNKAQDLKDWLEQQPIPQVKRRGGRKASPVNMAAKGWVKVPRQGTVRARFVEALRSGATRAELEAIIPPTNRNTLRTCLDALNRYTGYGVQEQGGCFTLIEPISSGA